MHSSIFCVLAHAILDALRSREYLQLQLLAYSRLGYLISALRSLLSFGHTAFFSCYFYWRTPSWNLIYFIRNIQFYLRTLPIKCEQNIVQSAHQIRMLTRHFNVWPVTQKTTVGAEWWGIRACPPTLQRLIALETCAAFVRVPIGAPPDNSQVRPRRQLQTSEQLY